MAGLDPRQSVRWLEVARLALGDLASEWRFARARVALTALSLWLLWSLVVFVFFVSELAVRQIRSRLSEEDPTLVHWTDARAWDGMSQLLAQADRLWPGDACSPLRLSQWDPSGGWHPRCISAPPSNDSRIARRPTAESAFTLGVRTEVSLMADRYESSSAASLVSSTRIPRLWRNLRLLQDTVRPVRHMAWFAFAVAEWVLFSCVLAFVRRRDPTVAMREVLGQRPIESVWAAAIELAFWTSTTCAIPLFVGFWLDLIDWKPLVVASAAYALSIGTLYRLVSRRHRRLSLWQRVMAGMD